eukprot:TRINITY_DN10244_c0_g4_i1.p1 TRINITY_DN10244_c0_g4~~TRINITY_DN10244_c0_g4_i1.p1  ORF type:complete len:269 (+),score=90.87 TRINITY_DN10244_c0_g4_i1:590-1396(+)
MSEAKQDYPEVDAFLQSISLERHKDLFIANGFEDLDSILELRDEHFQFMQVPLGHKLKILKRVKELRKDSPESVPAGEQKHSDLGQENKEEANTEKSVSNASGGLIDEDESHKEFLKAREAWLKERQAAAEAKGGFLAEIGNSAWTVPVMPEYAEEGTGTSPKGEGKGKEVKDCCFDCFKFFSKGEGFEEKEIKKTFCGKKCFENYFKNYSVKCQNCNTKLLCEKAILKSNVYFCSEDCCKALEAEKLHEGSGEGNKEIDEMLKLEEL